MSVKVLSRVWAQSAQRGNSLLLALAIADISDDQGYAWPSIVTLARKTRLSKRTTQRLLHSLELSQEVSIKRGGGIMGTHGGPQKTHLFRVMVGLEGDDKLAPPSRLRGGDKKAQGGAIQGRGGDIAVSPEPSLDPSFDPLKKESHFRRIANMANDPARKKPQGGHK